MILFNDKRTQLDDLLDKMAEKVQLGKTRYNRMIEHYEAVKDWIESDEQFFKPYKYDIYPHGSVRIQTTVKPIGKDEFDLDIAIHLKTSWANHSPQRIYNELKRRLGEHEKYKSMMELKNRCVRLNYAGDFHMDIMPGIQESEYNEDKIRVPDKELNSWVSSNPRGYAKWFHHKANMVKQSLLEKALRAEGLPADDFENKKPLQRAVQLIKRYRDICFQKDDSYKTSSIVLTTVAGQFYNGEDSIYETIDNVITKIRSKMNLQAGRIKVLNPVNEEEDFTDKWDDEPQYYIEFQKFCEFLYETWQKLKEENGVLEEGELLKGLFGTEIFVEAQKAQTDELENLRERGNLNINRSTGVLTSISGISSSPVKKNTFFGFGSKSDD
ncbi:MAG: nucleotidyltransferase [Flavobacteriaceae bacterium]|nr:nucleotidyltransferase [Flavobacteriaceae bacterium]MCB0485824.1 nucleotidyltransferase [Flavobacteriaceae bacterium]